MRGLDMAREFAFTSNARKWRFTRYCAKQTVYSKLTNMFSNCRVGFGSVPGGLANRVKGILQYSIFVVY